MRLRRAAVLGGGPGGLYAARLLKLADPGSQVNVYEQGLPDTTFGFGVGLAAGTQRNLRAADAPTLDEILRRGWPHDMSMRVGDQVARLPNTNVRAIGRATLLAILQQHAADAGVGLHFGTRVTAGDVNADLVIAADGVGSATRSALAGLGVRIDTGTGAVPVVRHGLRARQCHVRARHHQPRHVRDPRLPLRCRPQHVPDRDRRADLAARGL